MQACVFGPGLSSFESLRCQTEFRKVFMHLLRRGLAQEGRWTLRRCAANRSLAQLGQQTQGEITTTELQRLLAEGNCFSAHSTSRPGTVP